MGYLTETRESNAPRDIAENRPGAQSAPAREQAETVTTFGPGMLIVGDIVSTGSINIFGLVIGDIHAAQLTIGEGGRVEGKIKAQEAVIKGAFKGNLYGDAVKLQGAAMVDGEIYNRSLSIDQNVMFEGVTRRLERAVEAPRLGEIEAQAAADETLFVNSDILQLAPEHIVSQPIGIDEEILG